MNRSEFEQIAYHMEGAITHEAYHNAKMQMLMLAKDLKDANIQNWLDWWDQRKINWASAFRPSNNASSTCLNVCIHQRKHGAL